MVKRPAPGPGVISTKQLTHPDGARGSRRRAREGCGAAASQQEDQPLRVRAYGRRESAVLRLPLPANPDAGAGRGHQRDRQRCRRLGLQDLHDVLGRASRSPAPPLPPPPPPPPTLETWRQVVGQLGRGERRRLVALNDRVQAESPMNAG